MTEQADAEPPDEFGDRFRADQETALREALDEFARAAEDGLHGQIRGVPRPSPALDAAMEELQLAVVSSATQKTELDMMVRAHRVALDLAERRQSHLITQADARQRHILRTYRRVIQVVIGSYSAYAFSTHLGAAMQPHAATGSYVATALGASGAVGCLGVGPVTEWWVGRRERKRAEGAAMAKTSVEGDDDVPADH